MQDRRDVLENAAGMQIRRTSYEQMLAGRQNAAVVVSGRLQGAKGFRVQRDLAFATRGRLSAPALGFDQFADGVLAIADHFGRPANCGRDHFKTDHQDSQVEALVEAFQQHATIKLAGRLDGVLHLFDGLQVDRHALALFAVQRFDHHAPVLIQERQIVIGIARQLLHGQVQPGSLEHLVGQALVLAQGHADGAGQVTQ
ncbi:hypothetical protein D3C86_1496620 [compost metagenome]